MKRVRESKGLAQALLGVVILLCVMVSPGFAETKKESPPAQAPTTNPAPAPPSSSSPPAAPPPSGAPASCSPNSNQPCAQPPVQDSPAVQARVRELIQIVETKPSGTVINNRGQVNVPPQHKPYNPDGSRNQNYQVTHDKSQAQQSIVIANEKRRTEAIQELIRIGKPAVPQLVLALMNDASEYRSYYCYALGEIRDPRAVPALIRYMELGYEKLKIAPQIRANGNEPLAKKLEEDGKRMIADAAVALQKITGQNYGTDLAKWKQWWEANKAKVGPTPPLQAYTANPDELKPSPSSSPPPATPPTPSPSNSSKEKPKEQPKEKK